MTAPDSVAARAGRALSWSLINTIASRLGTFAIGIVLARILGPQEFGTFAVALLALFAVLSFSELGVSLAIVRWPGDPREIAPTVTTISVVTGTVLFLLVLAGAPVYTAAMGAPQATEVIRLLAVNILISGLLATPAALMQREFQAGRRMVVDQVGTWTGSVLSIVLALAGMGAMSLAIGRLAGAFASGVLFVAFVPRGLRFGFDRAVARRLLGFGLPLAGSSIVVFAVTYLDQLIVGGALGSVALGFYLYAFNLSSWPVNILSQPVRQVAPAAFARLQHDPPAMRRSFTASTGLLAAVTLPICLVLTGAAEPLVRFLYGAAWAPAADALVWLGLFAAVRVMFQLVYDYFVVLGSTRIVFAVQVVWLIALLPAVYAGATLAGIAGAAAAQLAVALLVVLPWYLWELRRCGIPIGGLARQIASPALAAVPVGAVGYLAQAWIPLDIAALAVVGVVLLAALAVQARRVKATIRELKTVGAEPAEPREVPTP
ncbi:oligosaccharide flippase family protein [Rhizohabitans arisaemae]|uniref:oligosaccharide flippase family protein n=1 Tax=Rhizohabitans arisaemae TaxID=2720610 RepID=UPI0024B1772E|nr:oligosaccharide flippase family protein [Rhizohabitans arisaemae]